ncbi:MAG TPA: hypothetical protein VMU72_00290 [Gaiellaceae bacterium]|nr:hypothetical protein [Gaiellaceae bacterium]
MRWFALSLVCAVVTGVAATAATARTTIISLKTGSTPPLATALYDPIFQTSQRSTAFAMASQAGATYARIDVSWKSVAPLTLPSSGFDPTDPSSPYYRWSSLDATVSAAVSHGVQPILDIVGTPKWAYHVKPGTWTGGQPDINSLGSFATALASRYDGSGPAPAVHAFSVYNEMNFNRNLYPQDPTYYRSMVNAVADSVHAVDPNNLALAGELAPFKHAATKTDKNNVIPPLNFMRTMLCISTTTPVKRTCSAQAKFDVWTHHPYSDKGPYGHASVSGGVELGDLPKMDKLLQTAYQLGAITTQSGQAPQFWVTEIGWSSKPPNTHGVPIGLLTRWVGESFYQLWKSGATLGTWFLLQDEPKSTPFQSGLYLNSPSLSGAKVKPLLAPFRFPFVAYLHSGGKVLIWGRDATSDRQTVTIQMKVDRKWKTVAVITSNKYGIFQGTLPVHAKSAYSMRASAQGVTSATFSLTKPYNENMNVTPFPAGG